MLIIEYIYYYYLLLLFIIVVVVIILLFICYYFFYFFLFFKERLEVHKRPPFTSLYNSCVHALCPAKRWFSVTAEMMKMMEARNERGRAERAVDIEELGRVF